MHMDHVIHIYICFIFNVRLFAGLLYEPSIFDWCAEVGYFLEFVCIYLGLNMKCIYFIISLISSELQYNPHHVAY